MRRTGLGAFGNITGKYSKGCDYVTTFNFYKDDKNKWVLELGSGNNKNIIAHKTD